MIPLGHVGGVPVEEFLPALGTTGASLLVARAWLAHRLRRDRDHGQGHGHRHEGVSGRGHGGRK